MQHRFNSDRGGLYPQTTRPLRPTAIDLAYRPPSRGQRCCKACNCPLLLTSNLSNANTSKGKISKLTTTHGSGRYISKARRRKPSHSLQNNINLGTFCCWNDRQLKQSVLALTYESRAWGAHVPLSSVKEKVTKNWKRKNYLPLIQVARYPHASWQTTETRHVAPKAPRKSPWWLPKHDILRAQHSKKGRNRMPYTNAHCTKNVHCKIHERLSNTSLQMFAKTRPCTY